MVGVEEESALARCSVVNYHGEIVYDKFVKPKQRVTDFRTKVSGITPLCLKNAITEKVALEEIHKLLEGKVLVGHTINQGFLFYTFIVLPNRFKSIKDSASKRFDS